MWPRARSIDSQSEGVPGSSPALTASLSCFCGSPEFNSFNTLEKSQLVGVLPVGILDLVCLI